MTSHQNHQLLLSGSNINGGYMNNEKDNLDLLEKYKKLFDDGVITDIEYNQRKDEIFREIENNKVKLLSEKWIWALATIPLVVSYFLNIVFASMTDYIMYIPTIIIVILNIVFVNLDIGLVKGNGIEAERWMWLGILLVPVYLYVRKKNTNRNYVPLIIWILLCFLL